MKNLGVESPSTELRTAVTVMNSGGKPELCPFFGKCDGLLVLDAKDDSFEFRPNEGRTPESLCNLIVAAKPNRLICGYVGDPEKKKLRASGIDVRLGSCSCSVDELSAGFSDLPEA
tara:strand:- start:951 stop:1298 length:348 start_codon:yes stop_codon:yes gene_type:complete